MVAATVLVATPAFATGDVPQTAGPPDSSSYQNPVSVPPAENFGSPAMIRGRDGFWYAFGAGILRNPGDTSRPLFPILRSSDLVSWDYLGDIFTDETRPQWWSSNSLYHAPTIEYWDGKYVAIYTIKNAAGYPTPNKALGVATAPSPTGPWTDLGHPLVEPRYASLLPDGGERNIGVMDADVMTTPDGRHYLYYGGYYGGIHAVQLAQDGLSTVGETVKIGNEFMWEGPQARYRDGWYYLFNSSGHCCTGPVSGYSVWVARSRSPLGPFTASNWQPILRTAPGRTRVLSHNGNTWVGTGHHGLTTDLAGQDWLHFNGIERDNPYLNGDRGGARRPLLLDRLDWIDGWPTVRGGAGASDGRVRAPATDAVLADAFEQSEEPGHLWLDSTDWSIESEPAGGYLHTGQHSADHVLLARPTLEGDVRVRGAVRLPSTESDSGAVGLHLGPSDDDNWVRVLVDRAEAALRVELRHDGQTVTTASEPLPESFSYVDWHDLSIDVRGRELTATVSPAGQDQLAAATVTLPPGLGSGRIGVVASGAAADVDDFSATPLFTPHTELVPQPALGTVDPAYSDDFADGLGPEWTWVRQPAADVRDGGLEFPVQPGDLTGTRNDASVLLRDAPDGEWTVETKVEMGWGTEALPRHPKSGLVVYVDDDHHVRLTSMARGITRKTALLKEMPYAGRAVSSDNNVPSMAGPAGEETTWLRLHHDIDPVTGERHLRAGTSPDGVHWTWGGVQTLPGDAPVRIGLVSLGGDEAYPARFDYLRVYRNG